jgi:hypothetical protein
MEMLKGDLVGIERTWEDGWARGQNVSQGRKRGLFPIACLTPIVSGPKRTVIGDGTWRGGREEVDTCNEPFPQRIESIGLTRQSSKPQRFSFEYAQDIRNRRPLSHSSGKSRASLVEEIKSLQSDPDSLYIEVSTTIHQTCSFSGVLLSVEAIRPRSEI